MNKPPKLMVRDFTMRVLLDGGLNPNPAPGPMIECKIEKRTGKITITTWPVDGGPSHSETCSHEKATTILSVAFGTLVGAITNTSQIEIDHYGTLN